MTPFTPVNAAVVISTLLSVAVLVYVIRRMSADLATRTTLSPLARRLAAIAPWLAGVAIFPFAWFIGFVVGGNFGGAFASLITEGSSAEAVLIPLGIGLGLFVIAAGVSALVSFVTYRLAVAFGQRRPT